MRFFHFIRAIWQFFFSRGQRSGVEVYLRNIRSLEELERTGTMLFDIHRPGFVTTMEYYTFWNRCYMHYGDDRVLLAWCDKIRALINLRRGYHFGADGQRLAILQPDDYLYITIADNVDPSKPFAVGGQAGQRVMFKILNHETRTQP